MGETSAPAVKPVAVAVAKGKTTSKTETRTTSDAFPKGTKGCESPDGRQSKIVTSSLRGLKPDRQPYYGGARYDDATDYPEANEYSLDQDPQQYVISAESVTGDRLHGGEREKKPDYAGTREPNLYNLPEPSELWMLQPFLADGKIVYQMKNVQRGLYLKVSSEVHDVYYHLCVMGSEDDDDVSMYWEIGPGPERKIRNVYYDEYLIPANSNSTDLAMTHPRPSQEEDMKWVLTKKADIFKVKAPRPRHRG